MAEWERRRRVKKIKEKYGSPGDFIKKPLLKKAAPKLQKPPKRKADIKPLRGFGKKGIKHKRKIKISQDIEALKRVKEDVVD